MYTILSFLLRALVLAAGLVFAASLTVAFALVLVLWLLRAGWAKLTGNRITPFVMRVDPRQGFERMYRRAPQASGAAGSATGVEAALARRRVVDVTDVEAK